MQPRHIAAHPTLRTEAFSDDRNVNPDDEQLQQHAISQLAGQSGQPVDVVARVYRTKLAQLSEGASVHDFLILLAARRTREALLDNAQARV